MLTLPFRAMASYPDINRKYVKWNCIVLLLHEGGETVCKCKLSEIGVDVTDGVRLYRKLEPHKKMIKKLPSFQQKIILPPGSVIDTTSLDLSLLTHIIEILDTTNDYQFIESIKNLRRYRNVLFHMNNKQRDISKWTFDFFWSEISQVLRYLDYDMSLLEGLRTSHHLSPENEKRLKDILQKGRVDLLFLFFLFFSEDQSRKQMMNQLLINL